MEIQYIEQDFLQLFVHFFCKAAEGLSIFQINNTVFIECFRTRATFHPSLKKNYTLQLFLSRI